MARRQQGPPSLAGNLTRLALAVVAGAAVLVGGAALSGVYGYASRLTDQRLEDYRRFVIVEIEGLGRTGGESLDRIAGPAVGADGAPDAAAIAIQYGSVSEYFDRVVLAETSGTIQLVYPRRLASNVPTDVLALAEGAESGLRYSASADASGTPQLWVYRRAAQSADHVLLGQIHLGSLYSVMDRVGSADGRFAMIVDAQGAPILSSAGVSALALEGAEYVEGSDPGSGELAVAATRDPGHKGAWGVVSALPGLEWRVVVAEPTSVAVRDTWFALVPGALVFVLVGVAAAALVYFGAARLVQPLRELETRARKVRDGAYVRPLNVSRDDEVGRVAKAFNSLVLRLNALHDVADLMAGASNADQVLDLAMSSLRHIAPATSVVILLPDESGSRLVLARTNDPDLEEDASIPTSQTSWLAQAATAQGPACPLPSAAGATTPLAEWMRSSAKGIFVVPMSYGPERIGAMVLRNESHDLTEGEVEMVRTFAAQVAVAMRTSRLFEAEHSSRREAEVLRVVAEQLSNPADLEESLHVVTALAGALLGTSRGGVALDQPKRYGLADGTLVDSRGWIGLWRDLESAGAVSIERPALIDDVAVEPRLAAWAASRGVIGIVLVPLLHADEVCGVLGFEYQRITDEFSERHALLAGTIGKQVSLALENAFLFEQTTLRADNLETVFRITQAVSSSLQSKVVLNRVLDVVQKIFSADAVSLMTYDPVRRAIVTAMARGLVSQEMLYLEAERDQDIPGRVFESREPVRVGHLADDPERLSRLASEQGLNSLLAVPLLARGRSIGVLTVLSRTSDAFSREETELLMTFASQAALAIDNASLFSREHAVASALQSSLVPGRLPDVPGLDVASEYHPSSPDADIGGDYYDLFHTPDGRVALVIADVCGKGVAAATKTSMIKYSIRSLVAAGMGPGETLVSVNDLAKQGGDAADIVTAWLGFIDVAAGRIVYADGGHPPALLYDPATARFRRLGPTGPLLGALDGVEYEERSVGFPEEALLLLYTDGVTEARKGNRFFGEGRIRRLVKAEQDAEGSVRGLIEALERFAPGALRDDVAVVAVQRRASRLPSGEDTSA